MLMFSQAIMDELHLATEAFLETDDGCIVDKTTNKIKLSKIFKWYKEDFGSTSEKVSCLIESQDADYIVRSHK